MVSHPETSTDPGLTKELEMWVGKIWFEISEISCAQWNGTFRLHRPNPSHHAFGYCSRKQETKKRYWGQQFCQIERDFLVRVTEMTRPVKVDHHQSWSWIFRSDQTEMVHSIWCTNQKLISGILCWIESALSVKFAMFANHIKPEAGNGLVFSMKGWRGTVECEDQKMEYTSL